MINGHDLVISADTAKFGMPEIIRGSYGATATPSLFHGGIPIKKAFYISLTGRNLTGAEAERVGLVSQVVPENELDSYVETLAKELASRNGATLESAKIAAYMQKDLPFCTWPSSRRPRPAPHALLHQPAQRRGGLSALAKRRRHREICKAGG